MITVIWQVIWPMLLYTIITAIVAIYAVTKPHILWIMTISAFFTSLILGYFYYRRKQTGGRIYGTSWRVNFKAGRSAVLLLVLAGSLCIFLNNLIEISGLAAVSEGFEEASENIFSVSIWLQILAVGLAAPVVEELIFRGMGYGNLRRVMGIWPAAMISSILFALYHGNMVQAVYGFFVGVVLALVYEHFDGLLPAIWLHMGANLTSIALTRFSEYYPAFFEGVYYAAGGAVISGLLVFGCFYIIYDKKRRVRK